jgi:hypothetical protein
MDHCRCCSCCAEHSQLCQLAATAMESLQVYVAAASELEITLKEVLACINRFAAAEQKEHQWGEVKGTVS